MASKTTLILGILLTLLGAMGTYNAIRSFGKAPVARTDVETTGVISSMEATELRHAVGVTLDTTYRVKYKYTAANGETYTGEQTLDAAHYNALEKGDQVAVKYHSNVPSISGLPEIGVYISVDELPNFSPTNRLIGCLVTGVCGGLVVAAHVLARNELKQQAQADFAPAAGLAAGV